MRKNMLFTAILSASLLAGAVSARQLTAGSLPVSACIVGRPCTPTTNCGRLCFCLIPEGGTSGACEPNTLPQTRGSAPGRDREL